MRRILPILYSLCIQCPRLPSKTLSLLSICFLFICLICSTNIEAIGSNPEHCRNLFFTLSTHSDPFLSHLDTDVQEGLKADLQELTTYQKWVFIRALRNVRKLPDFKQVAGSTTHGILGVRIATFIFNHPLGRVVLVHEARHLHDMIRRGVPFRIRDRLQKLFVRDIVIKLETPAYQSKYDFLHRAFSENDLLRYKDKVAKKTEGVNEKRGLEFLLQSKHILDGNLNLIDTKSTRKRIRGDPSLQMEVTRLLELRADYFLYMDLKDAFSLSRDEFVSSRVARYAFRNQIQTELQQALKILLIGSIPVSIFVGWIWLQILQNDDESPESSDSAPVMGTITPRPKNVVLEL